MKAHIFKLLNYNAWRHQTIYNFLLQMKNSQQFLFINFDCLFFNSPKATIDHLLISDKFWKLRLLKQTQSEEYQKLCTYWGQDGAEKFNKHWANQQWMKHYKQEIQLMTNQYKNILNQYSSDQILSQNLEYPDSHGIIRKKVIQDVFTHIINHHTHHLGQLSAAYKSFSKCNDFPSTDYTYYLN